jgi:hypothetical protein
MKYKFNNRKEALQKVPHSHTIKHYAEEDKYIVEVEWKGEQLWTNKKKKNDKSK